MRVISRYINASIQYVGYRNEWREFNNFNFVLFDDAASHCVFYSVMLTEQYIIKTVLYYYINIIQVQPYYYFYYYQCIYYQKLQSPVETLLHQRRKRFVTTSHPYFGCHRCMHTRNRYIQFYTHTTAVRRSSQRLLFEQNK